MVAADLEMLVLVLMPSLPNYGPGGWGSGGKGAVLRSSDINCQGGASGLVVKSIVAIGGRVGVLSREHGTRVVNCAKY